LARKNDDDNPYSETLFKTLKYHRSYTSKDFKSIDKARNELPPLSFDIIPMLYYHIGEPMNSDMMFIDGIPKQVLWKGIYVDLSEGIVATILSEKVENGFIKHMVIEENQDDWKNWKCLISVHPSKKVTLHFHQNYDFIFPMIEKCATFYKIECKYRAPLNARYAKDFPEVEDVYNYSRREY
jgi:hypothetical protein